MILFQIMRDWVVIRKALFEGGNPVNPGGAGYPANQAPPIPHQGPIPLPYLPLPGGHNIPLPVIA